MRRQKNTQFSDKISVKQFEELSSFLKIQFVGTENSFKDLTNLRDKEAFSVKKKCILHLNNLNLINKTVNFPLGPSVKSKCNSYPS